MRKTALLACAILSACGASTPDPAPKGDAASDAARPPQDGGVGRDAGPDGRSPMGGPPDGPAPREDAAAAADARPPVQASDGAAGRTCASMEAVVFATTGTKGRVCLEQIPDEAAWRGISLDEGAVDVKRSTSYFLPFKPEADIPPTFLDANTWSAFPKSPGERTYSAWHVFFESLFFPGRPALSSFTGPNRIVVAGVVLEIQTPAAGRLWAYSVQAGETLSCAQQKDVHAQMQAAFALRPLYRVVFAGGAAMLAPAPPPGCTIPVFVLQ